MLCLVDVPSALDYGKKDKPAKFSVVGRTHLTQAREDKNFVHCKGGDRPQNTSTTLSPSRGAPFVGQTLSCWPCISSARRGAAGQLCGEAGGRVPGEGDPSFDQALVPFCCSGSSARGSEGGETNQGKGQSWAVPTAGRSWQSREVGPFPDSAIPPAPPTAALLYLLVRSGQESSCTASLLP